MFKKWSLILTVLIISVLAFTACTVKEEADEVSKLQVIDIYMGEVKAHGLDSIESTVANPEEVLIAEFHVWVPNVIVVSKGDTVQLNVTNPRSGVHSLEIPDLGIDTGALEPRGGSATVEFVADKAGTYPFKCDIAYNPDEDPRECDPDHPYMTGTLIVLDQ